MTNSDIRFGIVLGQRGEWDELVRRTKRVAETGWDSFDVVDHFYGLFDVMDPTLEAYTAMAGLVPYTGDMQLGVMVCGNTYRNPVLLLKQALTVDQMSGGRVTFGVGAGWTHREHEAYSWDFPSAKVRVDMFAEALEVWELLQSQERVNYEGVHYQLYDAPFEPKAIQGKLPVLIGGTKPRMLRLVVEHADIWNYVGELEGGIEGNKKVTDVCGELGRDPDSLRRSVSPAANFFESPEAFERHFNEFREAGFSDFRLPWPRNDAQEEVFDQVVTELIPRLRQSG